MAARSPEFRLRLPYVPRAIFKPYHARPQRWAVIVAHRRAGKTLVLPSHMLGELAAIVRSAVDAMGREGHGPIGPGLVELVPPRRFPTGELPANAGRKRGPLQADDAGNRCGYSAAIEFSWPSAPTKTTRFFSGTVPGLNSWLRVSIGSIQVSPAL